MYHLVFPAKYRRAVFDTIVDNELREVCLEIEQRYELKFLEIGTDEDHVNFLVQSVPVYSVRKIVQLIKSLLREKYFVDVRMYKRCFGAESFGVMVISQVRLGNTGMKR